MKMTKRNITYHVLGGHVNLEARKASEDKRTEAERIAAAHSYEAVNQG